MTDTIPDPQWGAVHTERSGKVELYPQQYRDALTRAYKKGVADLRALLASPPAEPVAYADPNDLAKDGNWDTFIVKHASEWHDGLRFKTPLYTSPPTPAAQVVERPTWRFVRHSIATILAGATDRSVAAWLDTIERAANNGHSPYNELRAALAAAPAEPAQPSMDATLRAEARRSATIVHPGRLEPAQPISEPEAKKRWLWNMDNFGTRQMRDLAADAKSADWAWEMALASKGASPQPGDGGNSNG